MEIRDLAQQGLSISELTRRVDPDRKTVRAAFKREGPPEKRQRGGRSESLLDPYKEEIQRLMACGVWNSQAVLRRIREHGYKGGITILKDFMQPYRPIRPKNATMRFETEPGHQAQVDFGEFGKIVHPDGQEERRYAFVYTLGYSRTLYVEFMTRQDRTAFLRGLAHAFAATAGVPAQALSDNLKPAVDGRDEEGKPVWNAEYPRFATHYGFRPAACRPGRSQTKGKVERPIRYIRESFFPLVDGAFQNVAQLNRLVTQWRNDVANVRVHGTTHERPVDRLAAERDALQPLPAFPAGVDEVRIRRVSRDAFIAWKANRYFVPWLWVGRDVLVRETERGDRVVEVAGIEIARHRLNREKHEVVLDKHHHEGLREATTWGSRGRHLLVPTEQVEERSLEEYERLAMGTGAGR